MEYNKKSMASVVMYGGLKIPIIAMPDHVRKKAVGTDVDSLIIKARTSGLSYYQLEELPARVALDKIIANGTAIFGFNLPESDFIATVIANEMHHVIMDFGYSQLTEEELLLAIRLNCEIKITYPAGFYPEDTVERFGEFFSVGLLSKLLHRYKEVRNSFDKRIFNEVEMTKR